MPNTPFGFRPIRHLTGGAGGSFKTRRFQKTSTASPAAVIFPGDPIQLLADGTVQRLGPATAASTPAQRSCLGVAAAVVSDKDGHPKTFAAQGKGPYSATADTDWIEVWVDPNIVYECVANATATQADIGRTASVTAHTPNTAAGRSGYGIDDAETSAAVAGEGSTFRIIGLSPRSLSQTSAASGLVEVVINNHAFKNPLTI